MTLNEHAVFPDLDQVVWMTGISNDLTRAANRYDLGYLVTPDSDPSALQPQHYEWSGADNGIFGLSKRGKDFDADRWARWLEKLDPARTLFAALPDVLHWIKDPETGVVFPVGDKDATLVRSAQYVDVVKSLGLPAALVAQDGLTSLTEVTFDFDALFIGGSDEYKLGPDAAAVTAEAKAQGKWVHMGRVNSLKRLRYAASIGCDSADGTFLRFGGKKYAVEQFAKVVKWLDTIEPKPTTKELVFA
jgi:hypothetical protein